MAALHAISSYSTLYMSSSMSPLRNPRARRRPYLKFAISPKVCVAPLQSLHIPNPEPSPISLWINYAENINVDTSSVMTGGGGGGGGGKRGCFCGFEGDRNDDDDHDDYYDDDYNNKKKKNKKNKKKKKNEKRKIKSEAPVAREKARALRSLDGSPQNLGAATKDGVGVMHNTTTAAEYAQRSSSFLEELRKISYAVVLTSIANLVFLPFLVHIIGSRYYPALSEHLIFHSHPGTAFPDASSGTSLSLLRRIGAMVCNGAKLFGIVTLSSLLGAVVTNAFINARKAVHDIAPGEFDNVPVLSPSVVYGICMAANRNLRYQIQLLFGVIKQRMLKLLLHQNKLFFGAVCFAAKNAKRFWNHPCGWIMVGLLASKWLKM